MIHTLRTTALGAFLVPATAMVAAAGLPTEGTLRAVPASPGRLTEVRYDEYSVDDGTGELDIGIGGALICLNHFEAVSPGPYIGSISVAWGDIPVGHDVTLLVYADDDGYPDLASTYLVCSRSAVVEHSGSDQFDDYLVECQLGSTVRHFFVGFCVEHGPDDSPARLDQTVPMGQSWAAGPATSDDCGGSGEFGWFLLIDEVFPGNWMIRASGCVLQPGVGGACCLPDGTCEYTYVARCADTLHGRWTPCVPCASMDCPQVEACCLPDGTCQLVAAFACADGGGEAQGEGTACEPDPCVPVAIEEMDWGAIKRHFR